MSVDLDAALQAAKDAALTAGAMIRDALEKRAATGVQVTVKGGVDLVTETDQQCEDAVMALLKGKFPDHTFVGEETTFAAGAAGDVEPLPSGPVWFVDPLDGTTNFVHAYPFVTVSIGLVLDGEPVVGVVYNPVMKELFAAAKGKGAFLNDRPIHVSGATSVKDAMVMNNVGASRDMSFIRKTLGRTEHLLANTVQAVRNSGSAAQNMAHVASGCLDCYYEDGYGGPWDVAAGCVLVQEAGGVVLEPEGTAFHLKLGKGKIMCGPELVCRDVARVIRSADVAMAEGGASTASPAGAKAGSGCPAHDPMVHALAGAAVGVVVNFRHVKSRCPVRMATCALAGAGAALTLSYLVRWATGRK